MQETMLIDKRFCGPPKSGNGGYVCGLTAGLLGGCAEVRLRKPVPLNQHLIVAKEPSGQKVRIRNDVGVIMEGTVANLEIEVPAPPSIEEAFSASMRYAGFDSHIFPTCFVCGPKREANDGLRIFAGPTQDAALVAAPWTPDDSLGDKTGKIRPEFVWAALDCPGAFALSQNGMFSAVLGTLTARVDRNLKAGEQYRVIGWEIGRENRKLFAGTAIFSASGELCAAARAIWIALGKKL